MYKKALERLGYEIKQLDKKGNRTGQGWKHH